MRIIGFIVIFSAAFGFSNLYAQTQHTSQYHDFVLSKVASGLEYPWGMAFLPNGDILVTEQDTPALRLLRKEGEKYQLDPKPITGLPNNIVLGGQGGLLDVVVNPEFSENQQIYLSYSGKGKWGVNTEIVVSTLRNHTLIAQETLFVALPKTRGGRHFGGRMVFDDQGLLYLTLGDRGNYSEEAQNPCNHIGALVRLTPDGKIPPNNPMIGRDCAQPEVYSYGHRNPQGIALDPSTRTLWSHEHGPRGGDELNILDTPAANYGWPEITYGIDYSGAIISEFTALPGMEQPKAYWVPSIAPSGMAFYTGDQFPQWQGDIFLGALRAQHLRRIKIVGDTVIEQEIMLEGIDRIREVENGPDGYLYFTTDDIDGGIYRLEPLD